MKKIKLNKNKKIFLGAVAIIIPLSGITGYFLYQNYQKAPVAVNNKVQVVAEKSKDSEINVWSYKNLINPSKEKTTNQFDYLFETQVEPVKNKGNKEFEDSDLFEKNLMALLQSGRLSDINQAKSIWFKNTENYNFTTNKNLITTSIAMDILKYDNYLELTKDVSSENIGEFASSFGEQLNKSKNPVTLSIIANQLPSSGQVKAVVDNKSFLTRGNQGGTEYLFTKQYKNNEITQSKLTVPVYNKGKVENVNKLIEAANSNPNVNSIYEVHQKSILDGEFVSYVIEDSEGKLTLYGNYFLKENKFAESKESHLSGNPDTSSTSKGSDDLNWDTFSQYFNQ